MMMNRLEAERKKIERRNAKSPRFRKQHQPHASPSSSAIRDNSASTQNIDPHGPNMNFSSLLCAPV
jgi:hypothetical protein